MKGGGSSSAHLRAEGGILGQCYPPHTQGQTRGAPQCFPSIPLLIQPVFIGLQYMAITVHTAAPPRRGVGVCVAPAASAPLLPWPPEPAQTPRVLLTAQARPSLKMDRQPSKSVEPARLASACVSKPRQRGSTRLRTTEARLGSTLEPGEGTSVCTVA